MVQPEDAGVAVEEAEPGSWRDRALERSLRTARAKAMSRSDRFIATAMEILQETGRTDFTVQELVDRSRTSLRSFYQYFSGKDELLLALLEEAIADSVRQWREQVEGQTSLDALRIVIQQLYGAGSGEDPWMGLNRALASYHVSLADTHGSDYRHALMPLAQLMRDLIEQGVNDSALRSDIPLENLIPVVMQMVVGASMLNALYGDQHEGAFDADTMWEICRLGLEAKIAPTPGAQL